jgi:hypothetical protein
MTVGSSSSQARTSGFPHQLLTDHPTGWPSIVANPLCQYCSAQSSS